MSAAEQGKQPMREVRGILPKKKKMPHGWPACLKKSLPKVAFRNNDIYLVRSSDEDGHPYEESWEKEETQEKNMRVFYKLKINGDLSRLPHEEEFNEDNYESVEEWETTM